MPSRFNLIKEKYDNLINKKIDLLIDKKIIDKKLDILEKGLIRAGIKNNNNEDSDDDYEDDFELRKELKDVCVKNSDDDNDNDDNDDNDDKNDDNEIVGNCSICGEAVKISDL